jgi:ubiquinone/menaquinone biosynthesis C-methylase UbiE
MLSIGREKVQSKGLSAIIRLDIGDATNLTNLQSQDFDTITMSFGIRNIPKRAKALKEMKRVLREKGGELYILEFNLPTKGILAPIGRFILEYVTPNIGKLISSGNKHEHFHLLCVFRHYLFSYLTNHCLFVLLGSTREYQHLTDSIRGFPAPELFIAELEEHGFVRCKAVDVFLDSVYLFSCAN